MIQFFFQNSECTCEIGSIPMRILLAFSASFSQARDKTCSLCGLVKCIGFWKIQSRNFIKLSKNISLVLLKTLYYCQQFLHRAPLGLWSSCLFSCTAWGRSGCVSWPWMQTLGTAVCKSPQWLGSSPWAGAKWGLVCQGSHPQKDAQTSAKKCKKGLKTVNNYFLLRFQIDDLHKTFINLLT